MSDVSVILNVYNRPERLEKQIDVLLEQSVKIKPENIHVWYNKGDKAQKQPKNKDIKTYTCNWNTKFFGRFTLPLLCKTEYVAMFDDDMLPEKDWIKNCLDSMDKQEGIYGGSGVILKSKGYVPFSKVGWNGKHSNKIERVDLVGHAWFFKQEWVKYLWHDKPISWDNGEDIMFSFRAQKHGKINTFVPPHPEDKRNLWSTNYNFSASVGSDKNSSWLKKPHMGERNRISVNCINDGWKTVNNIK
jgi:hypothetical protein